MMFNSICVSRHVFDRNKTLSVNHDPQIFSVRCMGTPLSFPSFFVKGK